MFGTSKVSKWLTGLGKESILMLRDMADVLYGIQREDDDDTS